MDFDPRTAWRPEDWEATRKGLRKAETAVVLRRAGGVVSALVLTVGVGWSMSVFAPQWWDEWTQNLKTEWVALTGQGQGSSEAHPRTVHASDVPDEEALRENVAEELEAQVLVSDSQEWPKTESEMPQEDRNVEEGQEFSQSTSSFNAQTTPRLPTAVDQGLEAVSSGAEQTTEQAATTPRVAKEQVADHFLADAVWTRAETNDVGDVEHRGIPLAQPGNGLDSHPVVVALEGRSLESEAFLIPRMPQPQVLEEPELLGLVQVLAMNRSRALSWHASVEPMFGSFSAGVQRHVWQRSNAMVECGLTASWDQTPIHWSAWHPTDVYGGQELRRAQSDGAAVSWLSMAGMIHAGPLLRVGVMSRLGHEWTRRLNVGVWDPVQGAWMEGESPVVEWGRVAEANPWRWQPGVRLDVTPVEGWWLSVQAFHEADWRGARQLGVIEVEQSPLWVQIGVITW